MLILNDLSMCNYVDLNEIQTVFWHALTLENGFSIKVLFLFLSFQIWSKYNTEMPHTGKEVKIIYCFTDV